MIRESRSLPRTKPRPQNALYGVVHKVYKDAAKIALAYTEFWRDVYAVIYRDVVRGGL